MNQSTITINSLQVLDPTPYSVHMIQDATIFSNSSYHPYLDPFNVSIALNGSNPYSMMLLPGTTSGTAVPVHIDQNISIIDIDAFEEYNRQLMISEHITQVINGNTYLHEGGLPADYISYSKDVGLAGFNKLAGFELKNFTVLSKAMANGTNAVATVLIPNPTVLTIDMGNVTFENWVSNDPHGPNPSGNMSLVGNSTLTNFKFRPGNNTYGMYSTVNQLAVLGLIGSKGVYPDYVLPLTVVGKSSVYNGQELPFYNAAISASNLTINLNVTAAVNGLPQ